MTTLAQQNPVWLRRLLGPVVALTLLATMAGTSAPQAKKEWKAPSRAARKSNPVVASQRSVTEGRKLFQMFCVACHGKGGRGDGPAAVALMPKPKDLTSGPVVKQKDGELFWKIKAGRAPMPTFGPALKKEQIWSLVNFIRSIGPKKPQVRTDAKKTPAKVRTAKASSKTVGSR